MKVTLRPASAADAPECGRIIYDAFASIANRHGFPPDFPSVDFTVSVASELIAHPRFYSVVAEQDGRIVGSNFLDERSTIKGVGPITVDPAVQDRQVGRALMKAVLERSKEQGAAGVRLLQVAYHMRSLSLYAKLGFDVREGFAAMYGEPLGLSIPGCTVRTASVTDVDACDALCVRVHGHDRDMELRDSIEQATARVVERNGRITGYTTVIAFGGHSVAETNDDLQALIGSAETERDTAARDLAIAQGQRRDYEARLGTTFAHAGYLAELTALRHQLETALSRPAQEGAEASLPSVGTLVERLTALHAAHILEATPEWSAARRTATVEEAITTRIRQREQTEAVTEPTDPPSPAASATHAPAPAAAPESPITAPPAPALQAPPAPWTPPQQLRLF